MGLTIAENKTDIGEFNTLIGHGAAKYLNSGDGNTGYGYASLNKVSSGTNNIGIGYNSGFNITTGTYNICIGNGTGPTTGNATNSHRLYIDVGENSSTDRGVSSLIYGDQSGSNQDLTLNADVVISKSTTHSTGTSGRRWCDNFTWTTLRDIYDLWKKMKLQIEDGRTTVTGSAHRDSILLLQIVLVIFFKMKQIHM